MKTKLFRGDNHDQLYDNYSGWLELNNAEVVCTSICQTDGKFGDRTCLFMIVTFKVNENKEEDNG